MIVRLLNGLIVLNEYPKKQSNNRTIKQSDNQLINLTSKQYNNQTSFRVSSAVFTFNLCLAPHFKAKLFFWCPTGKSKHTGNLYALTFSNTTSCTDLPKSSLSSSTFTLKPPTTSPFNSDNFLVRFRFHNIRSILYMYSPVSSTNKIFPAVFKSDEVPANVSSIFKLPPTSTPSPIPILF